MSSVARRWAVRRRLLLLRHAKSAWDDPTLDDHDRPLARRGREAGKLIREHLRAAGEAPEAVLCSSAARTVQTLDAIGPALGAATTVSIDDGLYLAAAGTWLGRLRALPDDIGCAMVIGHNPGLEDLAGLLVGSGQRELRQRLAAKYPTGALATISFEGSWRDLAEGVGRLDGYFQPRRPRS